MLYYLFQWLDKYDFPGAGMFGYTSFRSLMAIILALLISSIWGDKFINLLKRKQITETQRDASIDPFGVNKVGVPSMGGVIIIFAILIPCLLLGKLSNIYMILMLITTIWLGSLGFAGVDSVRQGKVIELDLAGTDRAAAKEAVKKMCEKLLANTVIETYRIEIA